MKIYEFYKSHLINLKKKANKIYVKCHKRKGRRVLKKSIVTTELIVKENKVGILRVENVNYISLTDLAKYQKSTDPSFTVKNWLRRINTIDYIGL